jgi:hypothetical protein
LEAEIGPFLQEAWPDRDAEVMGRRWNWQYRDSARRLGVDPMVCMYRKEGIVAHQGIIPAKVKIGDTEWITGWFTDTMTLESVRGKAIGPMLIKKALESLPFNLSLGQTEYMRSIQFALGWTEIGPLRTYFYPLRPARVLRAKLANPLVRAAAAFAMAGRRRLHEARAWARRDTSVRSLELAQFDATYDRFWRKLASSLTCAVVRDASFMNWKFRDQPGQEFLRLAFFRRDDVVATAVIAFLSETEAYPYRRAIIVDLLLARDDRSGAVQVLSEIYKNCLARNADAVVIDIVDAYAENVLRSCGFLARQPRRVFLISRGDLPAAEWSLAGNHDNWLLTRADSDIDRPWN